MEIETAKLLTGWIEKENIENDADETRFCNIIADTDGMVLLVYNPKPSVKNRLMN